MEIAMYVVMYHYVRDLVNNRYPQIKGMDFDKFRSQITYFKKNYSIITMEDAVAAWNDNEKLPENALLLTFDDGYIDGYTNVFPLLHEEKLQGSFFISSKTFSENVLMDVNKIHFMLASADIQKLVQDIFEQIHYYREGGNKYNLPTAEELYDTYGIANRLDDKDTVFAKRILQTVLPLEVRREISSILFKKYVGMEEVAFSKELYMSYDQIRVMKDNGMHIGVHGYDHFWLANLATKDMQEDVDKALMAMDGLIDKDNWTMCYPYGSYNDEVVQYIAKKGCKLAFSTKVAVADKNVDSRFELPRFDCVDFFPISDNYIKYL